VEGRVAIDIVESWTDEKQSAWLYRELARTEKGRPWSDLCARLADEADRQAAIWEEQARADGVTLPTFRPSARARLVAALAKRLGARRMRPALAAIKVRGLSALTAGPPHTMPRSVSDVGRRHQGVGDSGGNLRAAVFGINDGLVSNASLILGVAGAGAEPQTIVLTGVAGLLAGAFSMAAGEWVSVRSQREMFEYQIGLERDELAEYPQEEARELALIYEARGLERDEARRLADRLISNPQTALDTLAREELGLDPDELGSPWGAASSSFASFAAGAILPVAPWLLLDAPAALYASVGVAALALFAVGAALSLFTGRNAALGGLRMLAIGGAAGALTFAVGSLLGVGLG
jgi:VIT1/CCC1 family predicted Fe2+/Mn2+ transporter